jgi:hypothetical protein
LKSTIAKLKVMKREERTRLLGGATHAKSQY